MKKIKSTKYGNVLIGTTILVLTMLYLFGTVALAQTSTKKSTNSDYSFFADPLSWGDVYSFDDKAFKGTNYSVVNGNTTAQKFYSNSDNTQTTQDTWSMPAYVGAVTFKTHTMPSNVIPMTSHTATQFRSNITMDSINAPIGNDVTISVAATTGTGIYSVVPDSTGSYVVYVYSPVSAPSNVKYSLIDSYTTANNYAGSPATDLSFTQVGTTGWYYSNAIAINNLGWYCFKPSIVTYSDTTDSGDTGIGPFTGNTILSQKNRYHNTWKAERVNFDTVLCLSFPSSVKLGPITKNGDTITIDSGENGTLAVQDIFGQAVATNSTVTKAHMPLFVTPTASGSYSFAGFGSNESVASLSDTLFEYDYESTVSLVSVWEQKVALPTITVSGNEEDLLDFYFTSTRSGSFTNGIQTAFIFTPNWGDADPNMTVSYTISGTAKDYDGNSLNTSGLLSNGAPLTVRPAFGGATVTFTNSINDKTMVYTIVSNVPDDAASYYIKGNPSVTYDYLDLAIDEAGSSGTVVVGKSGTAYYSSGFEYELPSGVTLLIPFEPGASSVKNTDLSNVSPYLVESTTRVVGSEYRSLTFKSGYILEVKGALCPSSKLLAYNTIQYGDYGCLRLDEGSKINVRSGGSVHAFGFIKGGENGSGKIYFYDGSFAYEPMTVFDYPGSADTTQTVYGAGSFPFREFYMMGIQVPAVFYKGSTESVVYSLWGNTAGTNMAWAKFIGSSSEYFLDTSVEGADGATTSVTKDYNNDRQTIMLDGSAKMQPMSVKVSGLTASTSGTSGIPIPCKYDLVVNSGTVSFDENIILGRGATATVNAGATLILNGKNAYILDSTDDWNPQCTFGFSVSGGDAKLDINGSLIIKNNGGLYTSNKATDSYAEIISIAENGKISYESAPPEKTSLTVKTVHNKSGTRTVSYAQLKNQDSTYTSTADADTNDWYAWNRTSHKWEKNIAITSALVHFNANEATSGSMSDQVFTIGVAQNLSSNAFARTGYEFAGWGTYSAQSPNNPTYTDGQEITLNADLSLYALWRETTFTATFNNWDGELLGTTANVTPLRPASYNGITPTKPATDDYIYEHNGWKDESTAIVYALSDGLPGMTQDTTYTATFREIPIPAIVPTVSTNPSNLSLSYGFSSGNVLSVTATAAPGHTLSYQWYSNNVATNVDGNAISGATSNTYTVPPGKNAGTYYFYCVATATRTGNGQTATGKSSYVTVTVNKTDPTVIAPTAIDGLTYSGSAQTLVNAGSASGGTMMYSLDNSTWDSTLPQGTNAGTYTVYYKVVGGTNYTDTAVASIEARIAYSVSITLTKTEIDKSTLQPGESTESMSIPYYTGCDTPMPPVLQYYNFTSGTVGGTEYKTAASFKTALDDYLAVNNTNPSVTLSYTRQQYTVNVFVNEASGSPLMTQLRDVGKSIRITAPANYGKPSKPFSYWEIKMTRSDGTTYQQFYNSISATIFPTESGTYNAIAHYEDEPHIQEPVSLRVAKVFAENVNGIKKVGAVLEVSVPESYIIEGIGFKFYTEDSGKISETICNDQGIKQHKFGSYTKRFTVDNKNSTYSVCGYLTYRVTEGGDLLTIYCTSDISARPEAVSVNDYSSLNYADLPKETVR